MKQAKNDYFAVTPPGLERICFDELRLLGLDPCDPIPGGVEFSGAQDALYLANLWLRSANRILVRLGAVQARDFPALYQRLLRLPWGKFIKPGTCCDVRAVSRRSRLSHTGRIVDVCQQAISRALGASSVGSNGRKQLVLLRISDDCVEVSIDSSGDHLHRRGYRQSRSAAPLRENLAAAVLLACGYDGSLPLIDMMTGSGTFVVEAGLIAANKPPGADRNFSFMQWPKYRSRLWRQLLEQARSNERTHIHPPIIGVDTNPKAVAAAQENLCRTQLGGVVDIRHQKLQNLTPTAETGLLIGNPPYGARLGRHAGLPQFYRDIEHLCTDRFAHWKCALVCPPTVVATMKNVRFDSLMSFSHGGIRVALYVKESAKSP